VHADLHRLSYKSVTAKRYSRYDVNGFRFRSTIFETYRLLATKTNTIVVTRAVDTQGHETKYYEIIKNIIKNNFAGIRILK
jgi:hypothetical protein